MSSPAIKSLLPKTVLTIAGRNIPVPALEEDFPLFELRESDLTLVLTFLSYIRGRLGEILVDSADPNDSILSERASEVVAFRIYCKKIIFFVNRHLDSGNTLTLEDLTEKNISDFTLLLSHWLERKISDENLIATIHLNQGPDEDGPVLINRKLMLPSGETILLCQSSQDLGDSFNIYRLVDNKKILIAKNRVRDLTAADFFIEFDDDIQFPTDLGDVYVRLRGDADWLIEENFTAIREYANFLCQGPLSEDIEDLLVDLESCCQTPTDLLATIVDLANGQITGSVARNGVYLEKNLIAGESTEEKTVNFRDSLIAELSSLIEDREMSCCVLNIDADFLPILEETCRFEPNPCFFKVAMNGPEHIVFVNNNSALMAKLRTIAKQESDASTEALPTAPVGLDFKRLVEEIGAIKRQLQSPALADLENLSLFQKYEERLLAIARGYAQCTAHFNHGEPLRDLSKMLAWTSQAGQAVCPEYLVRTNVDEKFFQLFIKTCVVFVIFLEDIGETLQGKQFKALSEVVSHIATLRIEDPQEVEPSDLDGFLELQDPEKKYTNLVNQSFTLLYEMLYNLSPEERMGCPNVQKIHLKMKNALLELFEMIGFSQSFNRLIKGEISHMKCTLLATGKEEELSLHHLPDAPTYIRQNQSNLFMRYMLLASFLQHWNHLEDGLRNGFDFDELLLAVDRLGLAIERLGRLANDIATFFRELYECSATNSLFVDALDQGIITVNEIKNVFAAIQGYPQEAKPLISRISSDISNGTYNSRALLLQEDTKFHPIIELVQKLNQGRIFQRAEESWARELDCIRVEFQSSPLYELMSLDQFLNQQTLFLRQYIDAKGSV